MEIDAKIYIAGHRGLVGSALVRRLQSLGYGNLLTRTKGELDLCDQAAVERFFLAERPDYAVIAAAKVGGISANNQFRAEFIHNNLAIAVNTVHAAWKAGVKRLLFLGSSCIYPRMCPQPMKEEHLLTSALEPTNEPYAIAKIAGLKLVESYNRQYGTDFFSVMPTNLYGPNDNYHPEHSHVLPALLRRFHEAKLAGDKPVTCWGTGAALREFLFVDDMADACLLALNRCHGGTYTGDFINVGSGQEVSIRQLSETIQKVVGHNGELRWDTTRPDGTPRKLMDSTRLHALGWRAKTTLEDGIRITYEDVLRSGAFPQR